jgi:transposase
MGVKTVGQIAREYEVHPVQVTQWKGVIRDHLPELFETSRPASEDSQELVAQLHEKIGQLSVEVDWLKKSANSWTCESPAEPDRTMCKTEHSPTVRTDGDLAERLLLRAAGGELGEPGVDAAAGRIASGLSRLWEPAFKGALGTRSPGDQPQASDQTAAAHGAPGGLSQALSEPTWRRASDLSLPAGRPGNQRSGPGLVQRHHVCADGLRAFGREHGRARSMDRQPVH